jgi:hypothetical protein
VTAKTSGQQLKQVVQRLIAGHPLGAAGDALTYCRLPDGRVVAVDSQGHKLVFSAEETARAAGEILSGTRLPATSARKEGNA